MIHLIVLAIVDVAWKGGQEQVDGTTSEKLTQGVKKLCYETLSDAIGVTGQ